MADIYSPSYDPVKITKKEYPDYSSEDNEKTKTPRPKSQSKIPPPIQVLIALSLTTLILIIFLRLQFSESSRPDETTPNKVSLPTNQEANAQPEQEILKDQYVINNNLPPEELIPQYPGAILDDFRRVGDLPLQFRFGYRVKKKGGEVYKWYLENLNSYGWYITEYSSFDEKNQTGKITSEQKDYTLSIKIEKEVKISEKEDPNIQVFIDLTRNNP